MTNVDQTFFEENGYVVVEGIVSKEKCEAVVSDIHAFLEMTDGDRESWYQGKRGRSGLAHIHQMQSLWDIRQDPAVHAAFARLYGTEKLWVSMDRTSMKVPSDPNHPEFEDRGFLHWDMDTSTDPATWTFFVQGVLVLRDTDASMGGFQCVPGFHGQNLKDWIPTQPADRNPMHPALDTLPEGKSVVPIPAKQGDLVIWDRTLAHGNGHNKGNLPRFAQYLTMYPAGTEEAAVDRVACWQGVRAPHFWEKDIPEALKSRERELQSTPSILTPLGRKLLGADSWES
ncbi:MAG: phytanoyl-CoA dioxygenase family protein [Armatimonas sp.]